MEEIYNLEKFRKDAHELIDILCDDLNDAKNDEIPAITHKSPEEIFSYWQTDFNSGLVPANSVLKELIRDSFQSYSHKYLAHQVATPAPAAILGAITEVTLSNSLAVFEQTPTATILEKITTDWFAKELGYKEGGGFVTSGGTLGNLTALLTARAVKVPDFAQKKLAILVSEQAHYSIERAGQTMGLAKEALIKIPTDSNFKVNLVAMQEAYDQAVKDGFTVFAVVGCGCSTSTGSFDDLNALADFCKEKNIWLHVDGAHGGAFALSEKYKHLVSGIHRADSVIIDFHKMLMTSSLATMVLYKNEKDSYKTFYQKAEYLIKSDEDTWTDLARRTVECTKPAAIFRIYSLLRAHGKAGLVKSIDHLIDTTKMFAELIKGQPDFELALEPEANIICFRYTGDALKNDLSGNNKKMREYLIRNTHFNIVSTIINGDFYLRCAIMNPFANENTFSELLNSLREASKEI